MTKTDIVSNVSRTLHKVGFSLKKHSPEILITVGVAGTITSAVMACRATTKIGEILDETKDTVDAIHEGMEKGEVRGKEYTKEVGKKDLTLVYTQTGLKLAKLYAPSIILGGLSMACMISSNQILRKRNVALAAAYATLDKGFKQYRGRVIERFGKELDHELRYNVKSKEIEETVVDEKGNDKTVTKTVGVVDPNEISDYSRIFYEGNIGWTKDAEHNKLFLRQQQAYANDLLHRRGYVFLNEVYEMLGFKKTKAGHVVGWVYDEENPVGDNFIDFGIYDLNDPAKIMFVNGDENCIHLDFNVDGVVYDLIRWRDGL